MGQGKPQWASPDGKPSQKSVAPGGVAPFLLHPATTGWKDAEKKVKILCRASFPWVSTQAGGHTVDVC